MPKNKIYLTKEKRIYRNKAARITKLLEHLANPDNKWPDNKTEMSELMGYASVKAMYTSFTANDLANIEQKGLELRRARYPRLLSKVDKGILNKGAEGDAGAAKLCYQVFEGFAEKKQHEHTFDLSERMQRARERSKIKPVEGRVIE